MPVFLVSIMSVPATGQLLDNAFAAASSNGHSAEEIPLGTLNSLTLFLPNLFKSKKSLRNLSMLGLLDRKTNITTNFNLQVKFGVGSAFHGELYMFLDSVLHFQSPEGFEECLSNGFSFHVTGGFENKIIAGVTFTVADDGVFIDALGVATGKGPNVGKLCVQQYGSTNAFRKLDLAQKERLGSFQRLGLGQLLMLLVERCATKWCTVNKAFIYLKMNTDCTHFYDRIGYKSLPSQLSLPAGLLAKVPSSNYATAPPEIVLMRKPVLKKVGVTEKPKAKAPKPGKKNYPRNECISCC